MTEPAVAPSRDLPSAAVMRLALAGAALLLVVAAGAFYFASGNARQATGGATGLSVAISAGGCEPAALTTTAGRTPFSVVNRSDRALEWEILDGVMVVAERENIAPGLTATLSPRLAPGTYEITCGLLSNPHGTLTVLPSADAPAAPPDLTAFIGPLAEMQVYLITEGAAFADAAAALQQAIAAGDLGAARAAYPAATAAYARVEPVARRFADLGASIDATAAYYGGREADPAFTGLHRLEYGLFARSSLDALGPVAGRLVADAGALADRLAARTPEPGSLAGDAADWLAATSRTLAADGEELYAGNDLGDLSAGLETVRKSIDLTIPLAKPFAADLGGRVEDAWKTLSADLMALRTTGGFPAWGEVPADARTRLASDLATLAEALSALDDRITGAAA